MPALGYTIENQTLGRVLWERLHGESPDGAGARESNCSRVRHDCTEVAVDSGGAAESVRAKLVVAADGVRSVVRDALGVATTEDDYGQRAVVFNCSTEARLDGRAFERFTPRGPDSRSCR